LVWDGIGAVDPSAEVDEPAAIRAEREALEVVEPGDLVSLAAGRTLAPDHGFVPPVEGLGSALGASDLGVAVSAGFDAASDEVLSASAPFF
jgi:hypothetical protein